MDKYYELIPIHGAATLLFALDRFEKHEEFNECNKIVKAIQKHNTITGDDMPQRLTPEFILSLQDKLPTWTILEIVTYYVEKATLLITEVWFEELEKI